MNMNKINYVVAVVAATIAMVSSPPAQGATLTVNDGTAENSYVPFHFYYLDNAKCRTQVIYPASQLASMAGNSIREVQFYLNDEGYERSWTADDMILSLGETSTTSFASGNPEFLTGISTVYAGHMAGEAGGKLLTFKLASPYLYQGGNLVLQISLGKVGSTYPRASFVGATTDYDASAYTTTGSPVTGANFLPKTLFTYGEQAQYEASVSPGELVFPVTLLGSETQAVVSVVNTGVQQLPVSVSQVTGEGFYVALPASVLASDAKMDIPVKFAPVSGGDYQGTFTIDLGEAGTFEVSLSGKGMQEPSGLVTLFDVPARTLPEGWSGWVVTDNYDFDAGEYKFEEANESAEYFVTHQVDGVSGLAIDEANPIRDYPRQHTAYMISPAVQGNVMLMMAKLSNMGNVQAYEAVKSADDTWHISASPIALNWVADPGSGWGYMIGTVAEETHVAVKLSNMAIARFAAEVSGSGVDNQYVAAVSPESVDFGTVVAGKTVSRTVEVKNIGTKAFPVSVSVNPSDVFSATIPSSTINSGETVNVDVVFAPVADGDFTAVLKLDMGQAGIKEVALSGNGVAVEIGAEFVVDGVTYVVLAEGEAGVSAVSKDLVECVVPAVVTDDEGMQFNVVSVEREAFYWSNVAKVTLPEGLRSIGYGAFRTSPLAEINLPSTLTFIGDYAFRSTALTSVAIPDGITAIGSSVFASCEQLASVKLPSALTSIGSGAFYKAAITQIDIPATCTTIDMEAFEGCANLTSVILPQGLTKVSSMLFLGCTSLESVTIPQGVAEIETRAFESTALASLHLPASVGRIASSSFNDAPVGVITVDDANESFKVADGVLYSKDGSFLYLYPRNAQATEYAVADGCRGIVGGAFYGCKPATVVLPASMSGIDEYAFCLSELKEITLPDGIFLIGTQAFAGTKIEMLVLPASLTEVPDGMVASCAGLKSVTLGASVNLVGNRAFALCPALTEIIALGAVPAEFDGWDGQTDPFLNVDCDKVTVYCPDGADILAAYKASEWADFFKSIKNISERPVVGIDGVGAYGGVTVAGGSSVRVHLGENVADVRVFALDGAMLRELNGASGSLTIDGLQPAVYVVTVNGPAVSLSQKAVVR